MANIGEPMRREYVIPATQEPNLSALPVTKPEMRPSENPELEPAK